MLNFSESLIKLLTKINEMSRCGGPLKRDLSIHLLLRPSLFS